MPDILSVLLWLLGFVLAAVVVVYVRLLVHEFAHALAGRLVGHRIMLVQVGAGPLLLRLPCFDGNFELRLWPRHGLVSGLLPIASRYRMRSLVCVMAGPVADVVLVVAFFMLTRSAPVRDVGWLALMLFVLAGALAVTVLTSFVPRVDRHLGLPNDAMQAWQLCRMDERTATLVAGDHRRRLAIDRAWRKFARGERRTALAYWDDQVRNDESGIGFGRSVFVWACDGTAAALAELARERELLDQFVRRESGRQPAPGPEWHRNIALLRATLDTNEAFFAVHSGNAELLGDAERSIGRAMAANGRDAAVVRTFGVVQLALGNVERAMNNLRWAWGQSEPHYMRALCACYLARGHAQLGEAEPARDFLARAARLDPHCPLLDQYRSLTADALAASSALQH